MSAVRYPLLLGLLVLLVLTATTADAHPGSGIVVDRRGRAYFMDTGGGVWVVETSGKLVHVGDPRFHWMAIDESERPAWSRLPSIPGGEIRVVGSNPTLLVSSDVPIAIGSDGALYYAEFRRDDRLHMMKFTRSGERTALALLPLPAKGAPLRWINGLAAGREGSLYYTEDRAVRRIDRQGVVTTLAENILLPNCASIPGTESKPYLRGLAVAADGKVFVAASGCGAVLEVTPRGDIKPVLRTSPPWSPTAVATSPSGVYVLEYLHTAEEDRRAWIPRVRKILPNGNIVDVAAVQRTSAR